MPRYVKWNKKIEGGRTEKIILDLDEVQFARFVTLDEAPDDGSARDWIVLRMRDGRQIRYESDLANAIHEVLYLATDDRSDEPHALLHFFFGVNGDRVDENFGSVPATE